MCGIRLFGAVAALVLAAAACPAAGPNARDADQLRTLRARALFAGDELLGKVNIGVMVKGQMATLWGPVPSAALRLRAELLLRGLSEIKEVRNGLFVEDERSEDSSVPEFLPDVEPRRLPAQPELRRRVPPADWPREEATNS